MDHTVLLGWMNLDRERQSAELQRVAEAMAEEPRRTPVEQFDKLILRAAEYASERQARRDLARDTTRRAA